MIDNIFDILTDQHGHFDWKQATFEVIKDLLKRTIDRIVIPEFNDMDRFFGKQMQNSKLLVNSGEKDRNLFFNKMAER